MSKAFCAITRRRKRKNKIKFSHWQKAKKEARKSDEKLGWKRLALNFMAKYTKGEFPYTVRDTEKNKLYVRKAISIGGRQKQIWRLCEPPTAARAEEILMEIEAGLLVETNVESLELARLFVKIRSGQINFSEFKQALKTIEN